MFPVPGNAEQIVECGTELLHAGLIWTERDVEDQTTAPVFPPLKDGKSQRGKHPITQQTVAVFNMGKWCDH